MTVIVTIAAIGGGLLVGALTGHLLYRRRYTQQLETLQKQQADLEAREEALAQRQETLRKNESLSQKRHHQLKSLEEKLKQKEHSLKKRLEEAEQQRQAMLAEAEEGLRKAEIRQEEVLTLERQLSRRQEEFQRELSTFQKDLEKLETQRQAQEERVRELLRWEERLTDKEKLLEKRLEELAGLTRDQAMEHLLETLRAEAEKKAHQLSQQIIEEAQLKAVEESKRIIATVMSRVGVEQSVQASITVFNLESDEQKGRIIGREGRNIRTLEQFTGVEVIVDDTPNAIVLSSPDPIRREIASRTLQRLLEDGRVHPGRIEEMYKKVEQEIEKEIRQIGRQTLIDLDIRNVAPEVLELVGKMRFRFSFGQNLLHHSREVARLAALIASELGLPKEKIRLAKRAGLFHDIGKVSDDNPEMPHALLGMEILKRHKEHHEVLNAVGAHHDEIPMESIISPIVQLADAISGARPGARRETVEKYLQRIHELENIPKKYEGVRQAFALQAGRELRIIVDSDRASDQLVDQIAQDVAKTIESQLQYPGQIKVVVIREKRAEAYAR